MEHDELLADELLLDELLDDPHSSHVLKNESITAGVTGSSVLAS